MNKPIRIFLIKCLIFSSPVIALLVFYFITDPFKVIYHYDSYYVSGRPSYVVLNNDYLATETFIDKYPKYKYDSFIFGNSRSRFYEVKEWQKYITSDKCFHFDASGEGLYGIYHKIKFLDKNNVKIKNALIALDYFTLIKINKSTGHLFMQHPIYTGQSRISYQLEFLMTFVNPKFLVAYLDFKLTHKIKDYMTKDFLLDNIPIDYDNVSNEMKFAYFENMISENKEDFYKPRYNIYLDQFIHVSKDKSEQFPASIDVKQYLMLSEIKNIFKKNKTDYRIVINPLLFYHKKYNQQDLTYLNSIFGSNNVFDFSNDKNIIDNIYNYYDGTHYRPHVANYILSKIYRH